MFSFYMPRSNRLIFKLARYCLTGFLWILLCASNTVSAEDKLPAWVTEGPYVEERSFSIELPLERLANKLYVKIEIGGQSRHFVFDTGSPSMLSAALADELGLKAIDKRKGRDSHGAIIESDIVQIDLTLNGVTLHKVPMFSTDFSSSNVAKCMIRDGVLGSEVLPLCAWQIDLPDSVLRCNSKLEELDHVNHAEKVRLYDFGYPHAPIVDVRFANKARSKAMFDTGSPEYLAISPQDFDGAKRSGGIGQVISGFGSLGRSLGGQAPDGNQLKGELKSFSIDRIKLGEVDAVVRESPPSLIGASLLKHYIITLDPRSKAAYFEKYYEAPFMRSSFGLSLAFEPTMSVSLVWDKSPASKAGLQVGQLLNSINGEATSTSCDSIQNVLKAMSGDLVELEWEGGATKLIRETRLFQ